jgi:hypothetical protein
MHKRTYLDKYLLAKARVSLLIEWPIIVVIGILGDIFSWAKIPFSPYTTILDGVIF